MKNLFCIFFTIFVVSTSLFTQGPIVFDSLLLVRSERVYFDFGKAEIRPEADSLLTVLAKDLDGQADIYLRVTAHTDAVGSVKANQILSEKRGKAVRDSLEARGIDPLQFDLEVFGEKAPVASNATEEGRQQNRRATIEVYKNYPMTWLEGQITDQKTGEGIPADIVIRSRDYKDSLQTDQVGKFRTPVPDQTVIGLDVYAKGYFFETQMMRTNALEPMEFKVALPPALPGEKVDLNNFYFVGNQAILLPRSRPEMPKLLKFMQLNDSIKIEIAGHINRPRHPPVDEKSWDFNLSVRRARMVYNYLLEQGISAKRMRYKGYGNWEMRFPYATSEREQELNRRVEIRILESGEIISEEEK